MSTSLVGPFVTYDKDADTTYVDARAFFRTAVGKDMLYYMVKKGYLEKWNVRALFGYEVCTYSIIRIGRECKEIPIRGPYPSRDACQAAISAYIKEKVAEGTYSIKYDPPFLAFIVGVSHKAKKRKVETII